MFSYNVCLNLISVNSDSVLSYIISFSSSTKSEKFSWITCWLQKIICSWIFSKIKARAYIYMSFVLVFIVFNYSLCKNIKRKLLGSEPWSSLLCILLGFHHVICSYIILKDQCCTNTSHKWIWSFFVVISRWGSLFVFVEFRLRHHVWSSCCICWIDPPHTWKQLLSAPVLVLRDLFVGTRYSLWGDCILPKKESSCDSRWGRL